METEIASDFRQAGRRTCAGRLDSRRCGVVPGWEESNPPGGAALLAKAAPGEAALSRSDGFEVGHPLGTCVLADIPSLLQQDPLLCLALMQLCSS